MHSIVSAPLSPQSYLFVRSLDDRKVSHQGVFKASTLPLVIRYLLKDDRVASTIVLRAQQPDRFFVGYEPMDLTDKPVILVRDDGYPPIQPMKKDGP